MTIKTGTYMFVITLISFLIFTYNTKAIKIENCVDARENGTVFECISCYEGEVLNQYKTACITCPEDCVACYEDDTGLPYCSFCSPGFGIINGKCEACPDNCKTCESSSTGLKCVNCEDGYGLFEDICHGCSTGCYNCSFNNEGLSTCLYCQERWSLTSSGDCSWCGSNCLECTFDASDKAICSKCVSGYAVKKTDNKCSGCGNNCEECTWFSSGDRKCTKCREGYELQEDPTNPCIECPSDCKICDNEPISPDSHIAKCIQCVDGFSVENNECIECSPSNCISCNETGCIQCGDGYGVKDGTCHGCPDGCQTCVWTEETINGVTNWLFKCPWNRCYPGYAYNSVQEICNQCMHKCTDCTMNHKEDLLCPKCDQGFIWDSLEQSCKSCSGYTNDNCIECSGDTVGQVLCTKCSSGFVATGKDSECKRCVESFPSCTDCMYTQKSDRCVQCVDGYVLRENGACIAQCYKCASADLQGWSESDKCDPSNPEASMSLVTCNGACAVDMHEDATGNIKIRRYCSEEACKTTFGLGVCWAYLDNSIWDCTRCCVGTKCNKFDVKHPDVK